jgi:hypothetical protein
MLSRQETTDIETKGSQITLWKYSSMIWIDKTIRIARNPIFINRYRDSLIKYPHIQLNAVTAQFYNQLL